MTISQSENVMQQDQVETGAQMTSEQKVVLGSTTLGLLWIIWTQRSYLSHWRL